MTNFRSIYFVNRNKKRSSEENDETILSIIWFGNESETIERKIQLTNKLTTFDRLREYAMTRKDSSIIFILPKSISLENFSSIDLPEICTVYNEDLVCLYCLPTLILLVNKSIEKSEEAAEKELKKSEKRSRLSSVLALLRKQWFLIGLVVIICFAYIFRNIR